MLSSDPNYPIEPNIFPLAYELNASDLGHSLSPWVTIANDAGPPRDQATPIGVLAELRRDLQLIATSLGPRVREQAERELRQIRSELG